MHATETKATPEFRKTTETFKPGAETLPQRYFVSPAVFAEEQEKVFSKQWVLIGHQSQIAKSGDYSLRPVKVALREGFLFVTLADAAEIASTQRGGYMPLEEWFAPWARKFSRWNLPSLRSARRIEYDVRANWKLIVQNYSECYH